MKSHLLNGIKSRNGGVCSSATTCYTLTKTHKTPFKLANPDPKKNEASTQRGGDTTRQIIGLKKENAELLRMLNRSKEVFRTELKGHKEYIRNLKVTLEQVWPLVSSTSDEALKSRVNDCILLAEEQTDSSSVSNKDEQRLSEELQWLRRETSRMKLRIANKEKQRQELQAQAYSNQRENDCFQAFFRFQSVKPHIPFTVEIKFIIFVICFIKKDDRFY